MGLAWLSFNFWFILVFRLWLDLGLFFLDFLLFGLFKYLLRSRLGFLHHGHDKVSLLDVVLGCWLVVSIQNFAVSNEFESICFQIMGILASLLDLADGPLGFNL